MAVPVMRGHAAAQLTISIPFPVIDTERMPAGVRLVPLQDKFHIGMAATRELGELIVGDIGSIAQANEGVCGWSNAGLYARFLSAAAQESLDPIPRWQLRGRSPSAIHAPSLPEIASEVTLLASTPSAVVWAVFGLVTTRLNALMSVVATRPRANQSGLLRDLLARLGQECTPVCDCCLDLNHAAVVDRGLNPDAWQASVLFRTSHVIAPQLAIIQRDSR